MIFVGWRLELNHDNVWYGSQSKKMIEPNMLDAWNAILCNVCFHLHPQNMAATPRFWAQRIPWTKSCWKANLNGRSSHIF